MLDRFQLQELVNRLEGRIARKDKKIEKLEYALVNSTSKEAEAKAALAADNEVLAYRVLSLEDSNVALRTGVSDAKIINAQLEQQVKNLEENNKYLKYQVYELAHKQDDINELKNSKLVLKEQVTNLEDHIEELKVDVLEQEDSNAVLEARIENLINANHELELEINDLNNSNIVLALKTRIVAEEKAKEAVVKSNNLLKARVDYLEDYHLTLELQIEGLEKKTKDLEIKELAKGVSIGTLLKITSQLESERDDLKEELSQLEARETSYKALEHDNKFLEYRANELENERDKLEEALQEFKNKEENDDAPKLAWHPWPYSENGFPLQPKEMEPGKKYLAKLNTLFPAYKIARLNKRSNKVLLNEALDTIARPTHYALLEDPND